MISAVRNRQWSPELGAFVSPDEFGYATTTGTLWSWPGQNPMRWRDPFGNEPIPEGLRNQLQYYYPAIDLSDVNVNRNSLRISENANAEAKGYDIDFAPGLDPFAGRGLRTLAHELTHVQQYEQFNRDRGWILTLFGYDFYKESREKYPESLPHDERWWEYLAIQWGTHVYAEISQVCKD
ncbi:MAG: DUF4157 domain-containing protein [Myxococcales bacterium]|nr:DUF4157 domain-containing protein [Myxococcales bacterium]